MLYRVAMNFAHLALLLTLCMACSSTDSALPAPPREGLWRAVLDSPGGELAFELRLMRDKAGWRAEVSNGEEIIPCGEVSFRDGELSIALEPYDSTLRARVSENREELVGEWRKFLDAEREATLGFRATYGEAPRYALKRATDKAREHLSGRWSVNFDSDEQPAVGIFEAFPDGRATGTFLTALGDYRYLAGSYNGERLLLSCFDGGHAFLFEASLQADGTLEGDFWSRDSWHETWTAERDPDAALDDPFALSQWTGSALAELSFPDLEGTPRSLTDEAFAGRARLISLFGTWCPNCNDEAAFLAELDARYASRGLSILGLAFELTDDFERNVRQVRRFQERHAASYPVLVAGLANKQRASEAFPALDRVRAFPTALFIDSSGDVHAIHTGFAGPATGAAHDEMRERYELLIEELLGE